MTCGCDSKGYSSKMQHVAQCTYIPNIQKYCSTEHIRDHKNSMLLGDNWRLKDSYNLKRILSEVVHTLSKKTAAHWWPSKYVAVVKYQITLPLQSCAHNEHFPMNILYASQWRYITNEGNQIADPRTLYKFSAARRLRSVFGHRSINARSIYTSHTEQV